jgi:hypothetical protein
MKRHSAITVGKGKPNNTGFSVMALTRNMISKLTSPSIASSSLFLQRSQIKISGRYLSTDAPSDNIVTDVASKVALPTEPIGLAEKATDALLNTTNQTVLEVGSTIIQSSPSLSHAALSYGDFKALDLCHKTPVGAAEWLLETVKVSTGLPWWATILCSVVISRVAMTPFFISSQRNNALLHNIRPELDVINARVAQHEQAGDKALVQQERYQLAQVYRKHGINPLTSLALPLVQLPIMVSFFIALRKIAALEHPIMQHGGILWFQDLSLPDPMYALPVLTCFSFLSVMKVALILCQTTT